MIFRRLALFVLLCFVASFVSAVVGEASAVVGSAGHSDGSRCPDQGSDGGPCGPGCACVCCPGHWTGAALPALEISLGLPLSGTPECSPPGDLHPKDVLDSIFRPPRA